MIQVTVLIRSRDRKHNKADDNNKNNIADIGFDNSNNSITNNKMTNITFITTRYAPMPFIYFRRYDNRYPMQVLNNKSRELPLKRFADTKGKFKNSEPAFPSRALFALMINMYTRQGR